MAEKRLTFLVEFLDVVKSDKFVHGFTEAMDNLGNKIVRITDKSFDVEGSATDPSRGEAKFVVVSRCRVGTRGFSGLPGSIEVKAIRLRNDGTFDSAGEQIVFTSGKFSGGVYEVSLVGRMALVPVEDQETTLLEP